jgi:hypothetical protein
MFSVSSLCSPYSVRHSVEGSIDEPAAAGQWFGLEQRLLMFHASKTHGADSGNWEEAPDVIESERIQQPVPAFYQCHHPGRLVVKGNV